MEMSAQDVMGKMAGQYRPLPDGYGAALARRQLPVNTKAEMSCIRRLSVANNTEDMKH